MGPKRRPNPRARGILLTTEIRSKRRSEEREFKTQVINLLEEILKLIKK